MFVLLVRFVAAQRRVEEARLAHAAYLRRHVANGTFLLAGPQRPPAGAMILTRDIGRAELERAIATDPYVIQGIAEYEVVEVAPRLVADPLRDALGAAGVALPTEPLARLSALLRTGRPDRAQSQKPLGPAQAAPRNQVGKR